MRRTRQFYLDLFISWRWYSVMAGIALLFFFSYFIAPLFLVTQGLLTVFVIITVADAVLLFRGRGTVSGHRVLAPRFSLGDTNSVAVTLLNTFPFSVGVHILDELPPQFQQRKFRLVLSMHAKTRATARYELRPLTRGLYEFGNLYAFIQSPLRLLQRRIEIAGPAAMRVYPSFLHLRQHELAATTDSLFTGVRKVRRLGHSMEFETVKEYVRGDDSRTLNWKATARRGALMVNTYTDTRQQPVYCLLDAGRVMKMPFDGLTLLDHSINAALALLRVALLRQDRAGLVVFSHKVTETIAAERLASQMARLQEALYAVQTTYLDTDYNALWTRLHRQLPQRSFLLLFTNFETRASLDRQLPYLRQLARRHILCVVFFQNTLLKTLRENQPKNTEGIYIQTIADRFDYEKRLVVKELQRHGIIALLTTPGNLTGDVIAKYLELKTRQVI